MFRQFQQTAHTLDEWVKQDRICLVQKIRNPVFRKHLMSIGRIHLHIAGYDCNILIAIALPNQSPDLPGRKTKFLHWSQKARNVQLVLSLHLFHAGLLSQSKQILLQMIQERSFCKAMFFAVL